jgi:hypothetical protein
VHVRSANSYPSEGETYLSKAMFAYVRYAKQRGKLLSGKLTISFITTTKPPFVKLGTERCLLTTQLSRHDQLAILQRHAQLRLSLYLSAGSDAVQMPVCIPCIDFPVPSNHKMPCIMHPSHSRAAPHTHLTNSFTTSARKDPRYCTLPVPTFQPIPNPLPW